MHHVAITQVVSYSHLSIILTRYLYFYCPLLQPYSKKSLTCGSYIQG